MQSKATEFVVGFMFSHDRSRVALIRKNKPAWQAGKLNGLGGKIDPGESPLVAMAREFDEESGYETSLAQWQMFAEMGGINDDKSEFKVYFFTTEGDIDQLRSMESESVEVHRTDSFHPLRKDVIENLCWLMPLALDFMYDGRPKYTISSYV
jgi:8-oxo-dGTP diphosphatase